MRVVGCVGVCVPINRMYRLLEELGLKDIDGDGILEYPDRSDVSLVFDVSNDVNSIDVTVSEMLKKYFKDIGIDTVLSIQSVNIISARVSEKTASLWMNWVPASEPYFPESYLGRRFSPPGSGVLNGGVLKDPPPELTEMWAIEQRLTSTLYVEKFKETVIKYWTRFTDVVFQIAITGAVPVPVVVSNLMGNVPSTRIILDEIYSAATTSSTSNRTIEARRNHLLGRKTLQ